MAYGWLEMSEGRSPREAADEQSYPVARLEVLYDGDNCQSRTYLDRCGSFEAVAAIRVSRGEAGEVTRLAVTGINHFA